MIELKFNRIREHVEETIRDCDELEKDNGLSDEGRGVLLMAKAIKQIMSEK